MDLPTDNSADAGGQFWDSEDAVSLIRNILQTPTSINLMSNVSTLTPTQQRNSVAVEGKLNALFQSRGLRQQHAI